MDKIFIHQLSVPAIIGVLPEERKTPQPILIDLEYETDVSKAAASDNIQHTIDYAAVRHTMIEFIEAAQFELLETLADKLVDHLKRSFSLSYLRLSITKKPFDMPDAAGVGVVIE